MKTIQGITAVIVSILVPSSVAHAAPSVADKCEASKNKIAGSYFACLQKAEATAITKMATPDYSKCTAKFDDKWDGAEAKAANDCPDSVLTPAINAYIAAESSSLTAIVSGGVIPSCGDGLINAVSEHCDGGELDGKTCADFGYAYGDLQCSGLCEFDVAACSSCPGGVYLGECYVLGTFGSDCDTTCGAVGMVYDEATELDAGSSGTDADCANILNVLNVPGAGLDNSFACADPVGCGSSPFTGRTRCTSPTTTAAGASGILSMQRACACH